MNIYEKKAYQSERRRIALELLKAHVSGARFPSSHHTWGITVDVALGLADNLLGKTKICSQEKE